MEPIKLTPHTQTYPLMGDSFQAWQLPSPAQEKKNTLKCWPKSFFSHETMSLRWSGETGGS